MEKMIETVTRTYTDDDGNEHRITGYDIEKLPAGQEHDFYQQGRYLKCNCHPHRAVQIPTGQQLIKDTGGFRIVPIEVL